jgi:hypothetical protein
MFSKRAALREQQWHSGRRSGCGRWGSMKVQLLEKEGRGRRGGGGGHPEYFLPKAEVPRLSKSIQ